jgi:L-asparaginase II
VSETFPLAAAVELATVERSGFIESRHAGSLIVLDPEGGVVRSLGDPAALVFPRSSLKPFQALAVMVAGVALDGEEAALATASHAGTPRHVAVVRGMLARAGLTEDALRCPAALPLDSAARNIVVRDGTAPSPVFMECSGKHAAMLMACVQNGWSVEDYLSPSHPLQVQIRDVIERLTGEKVPAVGIDGCGAPVFAVSLASLARGIQRIALSSESSPFALYRNAAILRRSVLENPWAIDGDGRPNTTVIERLGVFAKKGAEGVMVMAAADGTTVALKILDGSLRAATVVALTALAQAGSLNPEVVAALLPELETTVYGGGAAVGRIAATM